jgi:hypothetical protein
VTLQNWLLSRERKKVFDTPVCIQSVHEVSELAPFRPFLPRQVVADSSLAKINVCVVKALVAR